MLSEFNLGIEYIDATHFGKDLVPGTAVGATIAFDDATKNGQFNGINDNIINYAPKCYPLIVGWSKQKQSRGVDKLYLFGEKSIFWDVRLNGKGDGMAKYSPSIDETRVTEIFSI
ncbi:hypothetical protein [Cronobacter dublinensis]|uniref:hypothetical protein n=1 Tax=Cronobacter dublinensis TaxID=413497 RepID=UPI001319F43E|nr:hypothetical protein [Cronobacter dublinensis]